MKTQQTTLSVRIDKKTKDEAVKTLETLGLDLSTGIKMFLRTVVQTESIPFEIRTENGYTIAQELAIRQAVDEAMEEIRTGKAKLYTSAKEMHDDILNGSDDDDIE